MGTEELEQGTAGQRVLCPFDLQIWDVDRMLNFDIADDPHYEGLGLQVFNDPVHGRGMIVLLKRLLAPVGSTIEHPVSLPLLLMGGCDLVRMTGPAFDLRIGAGG